MAVVVNVHQAKTHLSRLPKRAHDGGEIILAKGGKPSARRAAGHRALRAASGRGTERVGGMKVLLDTHVLLWWLFNDPAMSQPARDMIRDPGNSVLVSAASAWQIATKHRLGRLPEGGGGGGDLPGPPWGGVPFPAPTGIRSTGC